MTKTAAIHSIVAISCLVICSKCNPVIAPLKGKYSDSSFQITTSKSSDTIWVKLTDIFVTHGLRVERIDKEKGAIRTVKAPINSLFTFEDQSGHLEQPEAWVVLPKAFNKKKEWKPGDIFGVWTVHVVGSEKGITTVKIDPTVICTYYPNAFTTMEHRGQSTGKLEELFVTSLTN